MSNEEDGKISPMLTQQLESSLGTLLKKPVESMSSKKEAFLSLKFLYKRGKQAVFAQEKICTFLLTNVSCKENKGGE